MDRAQAEIWIIWIGAAERKPSRLTSQTVSPSPGLRCLDRWAGWAGILGGARPTMIPDLTMSWSAYRRTRCAGSNCIIDLDQPRHLRMLFCWVPNRCVQWQWS